MDAKLFLILVSCCLPLRHLRVNSGFGGRVHPVSGKYRFHAGVDLKARSDTVFAIASGLVIAAGYDHRLGYYIRIAHGELESLYGHLSVIGVSPGDSVAVAEQIGLTGATGQVTGEHLHFALSYQHHSIDPLAFLCGWYSYQSFIKNNEHE